MSSGKRFLPKIVSGPGVGKERIKGFAAEVFEKQVRIVGEESHGWAWCLGKALKLITGS